MNTLSEVHHRRDGQAADTTRGERSRSILVLCDGNICRSPMAVAMLARRFPSDRIDSAGLVALVGNRAEPIAVALMRSRGIDISDHIAKQVSWSMAKSADVIFTMTDAQKKRVEALYPFARGRVFRIGHLSGSDVADPYQRGEAAFEWALKDIESAVASWLSVLNNETK
ncbi:protein tyrosine phosphatase [Burkholderia sp. Nafp2/4-1b]|nr:protein tyrosine phosphatase [Burkholderia sp. Nafp2/4-1b]